MADRIFRSVVITAALAVLLTALLLVPSMYRVYEDGILDEMRREADHIVHGLDLSGGGPEYFDGFTSSSRITLIAADGKVLYDNSADESYLGNHLSRPEVAEALETGSGSSTRHSDTLAETTIYFALRTGSGSVLRIASTRSSVLGTFMDVMPLIVVMLLCVILISLIIARYSANRIVRPINSLNLDEPLKNDTYEELAPLMTRMEFQHIEIRRQMSALERARTQLSAIVANMREGLILMDTNSEVLSMNESAARIFDVSSASRSGMNLVDICRDAEVGELVSRAQNDEYGDMLLTRDERKYRLYVSPVKLRKRIQGVVMLVLDVTERFAAEASRREFTANVSHELKTPLTSISGYAEIIRDGIALPEDIPVFAGRIFGDSRRLIALVNDILELSRLDERRGLGDACTVDLAPLIQEAVWEFTDIAAEKQIKLEFGGDDARINGYPLLLRELFHNLIENAVKYTPPHGNVHVDISNTQDGVVCTVSDTGIGIPQEHQAHIFERFYRVDKSHSRATGGTGLGLAIVKHAAEIHNAELKLESMENTGTTVTVRFRS